MEVTDGTDDQHERRRSVREGYVPKTVLEMGGTYTFDQRGVTSATPDRASPVVADRLEVKQLSHYGKTPQRTDVAQLRRAGHELRQIAPMALNRGERHPISQRAHSLQARQRVVHQPVAYRNRPTREALGERIRICLEQALLDGTPPSSVGRGCSIRQTVHQADRVVSIEASILDRPPRSDYGPTGP
jgi:hypothetical protein